MATAQRRTAPRPRSKAESDGPAGGNSPSPEKVTVLLVEEEARDSRRVERCLKEMLCYAAETTRAATLEQAREAVAKDAFDVALIDLHPGNDQGTRVLEALGGRDSEAALIFLTGPLDGEIQNAALEAGAVNLLNKDALTPDILENTIRSSLHVRKIENRLNEAYVELERATRSRADFFAKIGHDLKTPLNGIIGYSEAIAGEMFGPLGNPKYRDYAQAVREAGTHLLALIDNLIHFSIGDNQTVAFTRCDLNGLAASAIRMTDVIRQKRGHELDTRYAETPAYAHCQPSAITQAIINLLTNAIKYTCEDGRIEVAVRETARHVEVMISDNGIGMSAADISVALRPFGRVALAPELAQEGTGLGLHIVREIMARHRGQLDISSAPGKGTTAILRLPRSRNETKKG